MAIRSLIQRCDGAAQASKNTASQESRGQGGLAFRNFMVELSYTYVRVLVQCMFFDRPMQDSAKFLTKKARQSCLKTAFTIFSRA